MADADFHAKLRAHRTHMAAVPLAIGKVQAHLIDFDGKPIVDDAAPLDGLHCGELRTLLHEIERLQSREKQLLQDLRDEQREFQREAYEIAAEARWQERQDPDGRVICVHTEVGNDQTARVIVQEGEHHDRREALEPVDED